MKEYDITIEKNAEVESDLIKKTSVLDTDLMNFIGNLDKYYRHVQAVPSNCWIVKHGLNKYPSVTVVDSAGTVVVGEVQYIDTDNAKIKFTGAFSGEAYFN